MPDTPGLPSTPYLDNSVIGFDPASNLKIQADTYNRLSPIMTMQSAPYSQSDAHLAHVAGGLGGPPLPDITILDAITSKDPNIQSMGREAMEQDMRSKIPEYRLGLGQTIETPAALGEKYLNKKYGFSALRNNEDFYYDIRQQDTTTAGRVIGNVTNFLGRVAGETVTKLGEGLGYMGSMITSIGSNNYFEHVADNGFSKWFQNQEDWLKNDLLPVYKQAGFDNKGFFSKLVTPEFWTDDVADAAAFMTSFAAQTVLTGAAGDLVGLGRLGSLGINTASKLGKFGKGLDLGIKFMTGADDVAGIANHAFNTASESFFEAAGIFKETKQDFLDARARGELDYTDEQINHIASQRAASDFKGNLLALTVSNAFENRFMFQPLKRFIKGTTAANVNIGGTEGTLTGFSKVVEESINAEKKIFEYRNKFGKFLDWKNPQGRLRHYGTRALEAGVIEGLYEENIQLAMERLSRYGGYQDKNILQSWGKTASQLGSQTGAAFSGNDPEAMMSIGLGALIGVVGVGGIAKVFGGGKGNLFLGERRAEIAYADSAYNRYNVVKNHYLSAGDIFKTKEDGTPELDEHKNLIPDYDKAEAKAKGLGDFLKMTVSASDLINPISRRSVQDLVLADFVNATQEAGITDAVISRIAGLKNKSVSEITALGFNPAEVNNTPEELIKRINKQVEFHKEAQKSAVSRPAGVSASEFADKENLRKYLLYRANSLAHSQNEIHNTIADALTQGNLSSSADNLDADPAVQEHNSLATQLSLLNEWADGATKDKDFYKEHIAERKKDITTRLQQAKDSLQDKVDSGDLVDVGGILVPPSYSEKVKRAPFNFKTLGDKALPTAAIEDHIDLVNLRQHAGSKNTTEQYKYLAGKLGHIRNGFQNFNDYMSYQKDAEAKDAVVDEGTPQPEAGQTEVPVTEEVKHTVEKTDKGFEVVTPEGTHLPTAYSTLEEADQEAKKLDDIIEPPLPAPIPGDLVPDEPDEIKTILAPEELKLLTEDEISYDKAVSYITPLKSTTDDTVDLPNGDEQLSTDDYSLMRADFVKSFIGTKDFDKRFRFFIVKDTYPEVYKHNTELTEQAEDGTWRFKDPTAAGEVIIVTDANGIPMQISELFKYNKELASLPLIFSMDKGDFFGDEYPDRVMAKVKKAKGEMSYEEADAENRKLQQEGIQARSQIQAGTDRLEVKVIHWTGGIHPTTNDGSYRSVASVFGDFDFDVVKPDIPVSQGGTTSSQYSGKYPVGAVVARIGKETFPVTTNALSEFPDIMKKITDILDHKFDTVEDARKVRKDVLHTFVNTNQYRFFTIQDEGDKFVIKFKVARDEDIEAKANINTVRANGIESPTTIGDVQLNVSAEALKNGYLDFDPTKGMLEREKVGVQEYTDFIKPKLTTNLKKVIDKEGNLYTQPVNPYFSFTIVDPVKDAKVTKADNHNKVLKAINSGDYSTEYITKKAKEYLDDGKITQEQHDDIVEKAKKIKPIDVGPDAFLLSLKAQADAGTISQDAYEFARAQAEANKKKLEESQKAAAEQRRIQEEQKAKVEVKTEVKTEVNIEPKTESKPSSPASKYTKQDVVKAMTGASPTEMERPNYEVKSGKSKYRYDPDKNIIVIVATGVETKAKKIGNILSDLAFAYPLGTNEVGNTGFGRGRFKGVGSIYLLPTKAADNYIITNLDEEKMTLDELRKAIENDPVGKANLENFLNKYCK